MSSANVKSAQSPPHHPPRAVPTSPSPDDQQGRLASLEQGLQALGKAHDQNSAAFRDCLYVSEARQWIIMRVLDHLVQPGAEVARTHAGLVAWEHYENEYKNFHAEQVQQDLAQAEADELASSTPIVPDAVVFGG